jgi:hypothetical protein
MLERNEVKKTNCTKTTAAGGICRSWKDKLVVVSGCKKWDHAFQREKNEEKCSCSATRSIVEMDVAKFIN